MKSQQREPVPLEEERETLESETHQLVLEEELSRIRQIDVSVFENPHKLRKRKRTEEVRRSMSKSVKAVIPLLKVEGITLHKTIGKGGQAYVFYATHQSDVFIQMAVKVSLSGKFDFSRELKIMRRLKDRNVIRFVDLWRKKKTSSIPFMIFELAEGDMRSCYEGIIKTTKMLPSIERMRLWSKGIVSGVQFIHRSGLLHNDLKLDNILMVRHISKDKLVPKISDFGLSKVCLTEDGNLIRGHNRYGTPTFAPPEGLILQEVEDMRLMDVWALGLIVFTLLTDRSAFPLFPKNDFLDPEKVSARVDLLMTHKATMHLSGLSQVTEDDRQEIRTLLNRFLEPKISQRESIDAIAKDIWFEPGIALGG